MEVWLFTRIILWNLWFHFWCIQFHYNVCWISICCIRTHFWNSLYAFHTFNEVWFNGQNVRHHPYKSTLDSFLMNLKALTFENLYKLLYSLLEFKNLAWLDSIGLFFVNFTKAKISMEGTSSNSKFYNIKTMLMWFTLKISLEWSLIQIDINQTILEIRLDLVFLGIFIFPKIFCWVPGNWLNSGNNQKMVI